MNYQKEKYEIIACVTFVRIMFYALITVAAVSCASKDKNSNMRFHDKSCEEMHEDHKVKPEFSDESDYPEHECHSPEFNKNHKI